MSSRPQSQRDPNGESDGDAGVRRFIEDFALVLTEAGMPRMPARAFAALLASHSGTMTAGELAESLQVSAAAVSGAVRYLAHTGLVSRGREPGSRRDHYYLADDLWYTVYGRRDTLFHRLSDSLEIGIAAVGSDSAAGARMRDTRDFFDYLSKQLPLLVDQWHQQRARE